MSTQERFDHYFERFTHANTPEERQKVIEEYTEVCFSDLENELGNNLNGGIV